MKLNVKRRAKTAKHLFIEIDCEFSVHEVQKLIDHCLRIAAL
jgi:hypothetical protein